MTLTIEDGSGVSGANSYASIGYVEDYCATMGYFTFVGDRIKKERAIRRSMLYIEALPWKGYKEDADNSLEWPRCGVIDKNGYAVDSDEIPENILKALAEVTIREHQTTGTMQPDLGNDDTPSRAGIKRKKVDVLETEYFTASEGSGTYRRKYYPIIQGLLKGLINSTFSIPIRRS